MRFVRLTTPQKITHYLFPLMMASLALIPLLLFLTGWASQYPAPPVTVAAASAFILAAVISFIKQKMALRFYTILTNNSSTVNAKIIKTMLRQHGWQAVTITDNVIQATGHGFRHKLDLRTWAELITFVLNGGEIKVNSICDPAGRPQFGDHGKNRQNIRDFEVLFSQSRSTGEVITEGSR